MSNLVPAVSGRMPVTLITGYLGSGKTTLLNRLLPTPLFAHATVVINEFGNAPLDPLFVEKTDLCEEKRVALLDRRLAELNSDAKRLQAAHGDVPPEWLVGSAGASDTAMRRRFERLREREADADRRPAGPGNREGVVACALACDAPLDGLALVRWPDEARLQHGELLLYY